MPSRGVLTLLLVALPPVGARAQTRPLAEAVGVARSGDCLTAAALAEHMEAWLGRDAVDARLAVVVEEDGEGASFVVLHEGVPASTRRFDTLPADCADRRAAVALAIALAIDAALVDSLVPASAPPPQAPAPTPAPAPGPPSRAPAVRVELAVEAQILFEVLPEVAAGWQIGPRLVFDDTFELALSAAVTSIAGADLQPGRVDAQLAGARLDACLRREDDLTVRGCVGVSSGVGRGQGRDLPGAAETLLPYVGLFGRLGLAVRVHDALALEAALDAWLALLRPRFDVVVGDA